MRRYKRLRRCKRRHRDARLYYVHAPSQILTAWDYPKIGDYTRLGLESDFVKWCPACGAIQFKGDRHWKYPAASARREVARDERPK